MTANLLPTDAALVPRRDVERLLVRQMKTLQGPGAAPVQRAIRAG